MIRELPTHLTKLVTKHTKTILIFSSLLLLTSLFAIPHIKSVKADPVSPALDGLTQTIDNILGDSRLDGAQADVIVRDATTGDILYQHDPDNRLIPASNDKLYTSLAALKVLGTDYKFTTTISTTGKQFGNALQGNLYLKGTGDPTLQPADYGALAASVAAKGIRVITGNLVADDTFFDHRQLGNNWAWDNSPYSFQPEISALTVAADSYFDFGSLTVETKPGAHPGDPAQIKTIPATNFVQIDNQATTGNVGSANTIAVERKLGINTITVTGSIPVDGETEDDLSTVSDTTGYAISLFRDALKKHNIQIIGSTQRTQTPSNAQVLITKQSMPLSSLLTPFLKLSNNGIAEILVKSMGQKVKGQGTWDAGESVLNDTIATLGVDTNTVQIVDGSGLSNLDFIPSRQTTNLLIAAQKEPWFTTWYNALPIAGESDPLVGGTLRSRMKNTKAAGNVHGKTGSLVGVSALSGYVTDADGDKLVFSVMENNYLGYVKDIEDSIAVTLANFSKNGSTPAAQMKVQNHALLAPAATKPTKEQGWECSWTKEGC